MPTRWPQAEASGRGRRAQVGVRLRKTMFNGAMPQSPAGQLWGQWESPVGQPWPSGVLGSLRGLRSFSTGCRWPPHFCSTETTLSQGGTPCPPSAQRLPRCHSPSRTWNWSAVSQKPAGPGGVRAAGVGTRGGRAGHHSHEGHSPYLGKYQMWSSVRLAPWTRCSKVLRAASPTGRERAVGHTGLLGGAPTGGGQGALGTGSACL